jgi:hypothetical protein
MTAVIGLMHMTAVVERWTDERPRRSLAAIVFHHRDGSHGDGDGDGDGRT